MKPSTVLPESFYRIIDHSVLRHHKLRMPDEFVQNYAGGISNFVMINVPTGDSWRIGVQRVGKMLWLHDGWQNFVEHHSIGLGHFLIFNYQGNSKFLIHIFDITATEIEYSFTTNFKRPNHTIDNSGQEKEEFGAMVDSPLPSHVLTSFKLTAPHESTNKEAQGGNATVSPTNQHIETMFPEQIVEESHGRNRAFLATTYKPDNPSFMVTMKSYNVERSCILSFPSKFVKGHPLDGIDYIKLRDSDGRKWPVRCMRKKGKLTCLSKGWLAFVKAKELVSGDVCVFELIQGNEPMFKVSVFPTKNKHAKRVEVLQ